MNTITAALREMAQRMRTGFTGVVPLKYVKGKWIVGETEMNGTQLVSRPDWTMYGWTKWWDGRPVAYYLGYVTDRYVPPARETLGDDDKEQ